MKNDRAPSGGITLPPGTKIGKYEIVDMLAAGGQAILYKGRDPLLDRLVAMKQISSTLAADPTFLERFRREAQILARLGADQPGIVTVHELIEQPEGLFIVMEYVPGHTLERTLEDNPGPVEVKAVLQILWKLAAAMYAVHAAGIIHRDLKPSNIIVSEGLRVTITDFGVAASSTGQTSMLLGTTKYMAPELFTGQSVDSRADIYSLGLIAYEMLIGRGRFREIFSDIVRDPHSESLRWMKWHGNLAVSAPPACEVNPAVPRPLSDLVVRMMAKKVEERFQSMETLGRAIKQNFSPRARLPGAAAPAAEPMPGGRSVLDEEAPMATVVAAPAAEPKETTTAPIPKKKMSLKVKLALAGVAFVSLLVALVVMVISSSRQEKEAQRRAIDLYEQGMTCFKKLLYAEAATRFADVGRIPGARLEAAKAKVMETICKGHLSLEKRQWGDCDTYYDQAGKELVAVQRQHKDLVEWAELAQKNHLEVLHGKRRASKGFLERLNQAKALFDSREPNYEQVKELLNPEALDKYMAKLQESKANVLPALLAEAEALFRKADRQVMERITEEAVKEADRRAAQKEYKEAVEACTQARDKVLADKLLTEEDRKSCLRRIDEKIRQMSVEEKYQTAMDLFANAQAQGLLHQQRVYLKQAAELKPSAELTGQIAKLEQAIDRAAAEAAVKDPSRSVEERQAAVQQYAAKYPEDKWAQDLLEALKNEGRRNDLLTAGNDAFDRKDWQAAKGAFQEALRIMPDPTVEEKLKECDYQLLMGAARGLFAQKKYDGAIAKAEEARVSRPDKAAEVQAFQTDVQNNQVYDDRMAKAAAAFKNKSFKKAKDLLAEARKALPARAGQVEAMLAEVNYRQWLTQGDEAVQREEYPSAKFLYEQAQKVKDTEEIRRKLEELKAKMGPEARP